MSNITMTKILIKLNLSWENGVRIKIAIEFQRGSTFNIYVSIYVIFFSSYVQVRFALVGCLLMFFVFSLASTHNAAFFGTTRIERRKKRNYLKRKAIQEMRVLDRSRRCLMHILNIVVRLSASMWVYVSICTVWLQNNVEICIKLYV